MLAADTRPPPRSCDTFVCVRAATGGVGPACTLFGKNSDRPSEEAHEVCALTTARATATATATATSTATAAAAAAASTAAAAFAFVWCSKNSHVFTKRVLAIVCIAPRRKRCSHCPDGPVVSVLAEDSQFLLLVPFKIPVQ